MELKLENPLNEPHTGILDIRYILNAMSIICACTYLHREKESMMKSFEKSFVPLQQNGAKRDLCVSKLIVCLLYENNHTQ